MSNWFNKFADKTADAVAHAGFFFFCVLICLVWIPSFPLFPSGDSWQLIINTATTVLTFLMLALLHNSQHRFEEATSLRLEEIIDKLGGTKLSDPVKDPGQKPKERKKNK